MTGQRHDDLTRTHGATYAAWEGVAEMEREYRERNPDDDRTLLELVDAGAWQ